MESPGVIRSAGASAKARSRALRPSTPMRSRVCPRRPSATRAKTPSQRLWRRTPPKTSISWPTEPAGTFLPPICPSTKKKWPRGARSRWSVTEVAFRGAPRGVFSGKNPEFNMSLVSMTGFAEAPGAHGTVRWRWEVKSVNGRGLDLRLRMPPGFDSVEPAARMLAGERFKRGNIQATLTAEPQESARGLRIDMAALSSAVRIAKEVAAETGLAPARIDGILALKGVIVQDEAVALDAAARGARDAAILESLAYAFDALAKARAKEGAKLCHVLLGQMRDIANLTEEAGKLAAAQPAALRERLMAQLK